jgi:class 3 adenylate cyclase
LDIRYAWNGDSSLAYQALGDGPNDLVYLQGFLSNVLLNWEHAAFGRFLRQLSGFARLIVTDRRGLGCSDRFTPADVPPIESLVDDLLAVLDASECERPALFATADSGFIAMPFAATYPARVAALILFAADPTYMKSEDVPWGMTEEEMHEDTEQLCRGSWEKWWHQTNPSLCANERDLAWCLRYSHLSITPGGCLADGWRFNETDVRGILPTIQVPTLILRRPEDPWDAQASSYLASHIRTAKQIDVPGADVFPWAAHPEVVTREVERFLVSVRAEDADLDRTLATVLFTDIIRSTEKVAEVGDAGWRDLVERHHATVRALLARYRGREIDTAGDGFFASFDGPARAVRCAEAAVEAVKPLGIEIRAGVHTGEVERIGDKVGGIAVSIGARIGALASPSEVLVSQTVKDLVSGSGLVFEDRGEHTLRGVPETWQVFAARLGHN